MGSRSPYAKEENSKTPYKTEDPLFIVSWNLLLTRKAGCHTPGAGLHKNARHVFPVPYASGALPSLHSGSEHGVVLIV